MKSSKKCIAPVIFLFIGMFFALIMCNSMSWAQQPTAHVIFKLQGLNVPGQLQASVNPPSTGLGKPPIVVTVTGGKSPYTVSASITGWTIAPSGANTFTATRTINGTGSSSLTVTDTKGQTITVPVRAVLVLKLK